MLAPTIILMTATEPSRRRTVPVRVDSVPIEKRRQAAELAIRREQDEVERLRIRLLAEQPGDLVAWVAP